MVSCVLCAPGHNIATVAVVPIVHGGAQGAQQRILGQVAALAVRTLDLKWISLKAASPPLNSTIYVVYSDRFMLTPAAVSVDTMAMAMSMCGTVSGSEGSLFHDPTSSQRLQDN